MRFKSLLRQAIFFSSFLFMGPSHTEETPINLDQLDTRLSKLEHHHHYHKRYNPQATQAHGIILGADLLYWQARENGIPYAIEVPNPLTLDPPPVRKSHLLEFDFDWDFGVRAYGGLQFHRDGWTLLGTWTHFDTKAQDHGFTRRPPTEGRLPHPSSKAYQPVWADPDFIQSPDFVSHVRAKWKLLFNQADVMLSRGFYTGRFFVLEPSIGVSAVWIDQHMHTLYKRAINPGSSIGKFKNDFKGIGLRGGLDTRFCFWKHWSLFNTTHLGLYYGHFKLSRKEQFRTDTLPSHLAYEEVKDRYWQVSPEIDMQMGVRWDYAFAESHRALSVKLAYEYLIYFSQNQFLRIISNTPFTQIVENQGDLSLTGGTFSILLTF